MIKSFIRRIPLNGTAGDWKPIHPNHIIGLEALTIAWRLDVGSNTINRAVTGDITVTGKAYQFIKDTPNTDTIEMRLYDTRFNRDYPIFTAQPNTRSFCYDGTCKMTINIVENRPEKTCFDNTVIWDNHQNWFDNSGTKQHTRIGYCNHPNINFIAGLVYIMTLILAVLCFGLSLMLSALGISGLSDFLSGLINKSKGCDKAHPSPFVRDYIKNVCDKCNIGVGQFAPIFFNSTSIYYDTVVFYAPIKEGFDKSDTAINRYFIKDNVYNKTLTQFLDELATHFNCKWRVMGGELYFIPKREQYNSTPIFNFHSTDAHILTTPICGTWASEDSPAYFDGIYTQDAIDARGNTAMSLYNDVVEWNAPPSQSQRGALKVISPFASARFRQDGVTNDPISRLENNTLLSTIVSILEFATPLDVLFYPNDLVLSNDQTSKAKLLVWNNNSGIDSGTAIKMPLIAGSALLNYLQMDKQAISQTDTNYSMWLYNAPYITDDLINSGNYGGTAIKNMYDLYKDENPRSELGKTIRNITYDIQICLNEYNAQRLGIFEGQEIAIGYTIQVATENGNPILAEITAININLATNSILITAQR